MTIKAARAAIRNAKHVYTSVIFFEGADPQYIRAIKEQVLAQITPDAESEATGELRVLIIVRDDDVYIN